MINRFMLSEELEKKVIKITEVDYTGMLTIEDIENIIKDLIHEYNRLKEKYDDLEEDLKENYELKKIDYYDYYGVSKEDFY